MSEIHLIPIDKLTEFPNHPFTIKDDHEMVSLVKSIQDHGILEPVLLRKRADGMMEILSGNRRVHAAHLCGLKEVPAVCINCDNDEAVIRMVDANLHREKIDFRSRCRSVRMKRDALKHQGQRSPSRHTDEILAEERNVKPETIRRMCRLSELNDDIFDAIDDEQLGKTNAVELSYLTFEQQQDLCDVISSSCLTWADINHICKDLRKLAQTGCTITEETIRSLLNPPVPLASPKTKKEKEPSEKTKGSKIEVDISALKAIWGVNEISADEILKRIYDGARMTVEFSKEYASLHK